MALTEEEGKQRHSIFIHQRAADTGGQIHYSAAIIEKKKKKREGFFFPLYPCGLQLPLLGVSLPLFFAFRLVPRRLSGLKISRQSLLASGGSDGVFHQDKASTLSHWG